MFRRGLTLLMWVMAICYTHAQESYVIKNAQVLNFQSKKFEQKDIFVQNGKIQQLAKSIDKANVKTYDYKGKYIVPGLIDAHVHLTTGRYDKPEERRAHAEALAQKMLTGGITTVRDVGGNGELLKELQKESFKNEIKAPKIYYSAFIAGPSYYTEMGKTEFTPCEQSVDSNSNVEEVIRTAKEAGASGVKLYAALEVDLLNALSAEAQKQGLGVWGHATVMPAKPIDALNAGMEVMSHAEMLKWEQCPSLAMSMFDNYKKYYGKFKFDFPELEVLLKKMKEKNVILDATCYHGTVNGLKEAAIFTKKAHEMGVKVAVGTDYIGDQKLPYIHNELETLVNKCDFSPLEALKSATLIAAETFAKENKIGSIEEGKLADLLILNANPLTDIKNTTDIFLVIKEGKIIK